MRSLLFRSLALLLVSTVSTTVSSDILIENLEDITATGVPGTTRDLTITENLCVGVSPAGNYSIIARGDGPGGTFELSNSTASLVYRLFYRDRSVGFSELFPRVPLTGIPGRDLRPNDTCRGNASRIRLEIDHGQINNAAAGVYRGTLTLTVAPE